MRQEINLDLKLTEAIERYAGLKDYLLSLGLSQLQQPQLLATLGRQLTLRQMLSMKNLSESVFVREFQLRMEGEETVAEDAISLDGVLPCPIKLPLCQHLEQYAQERGLAIRGDFVSANLGLDGMKERLALAEQTGDSKQLPDILTSAGFEFFFGSTWLEHYASTGLYGVKPYEVDGDFEARGAKLLDPKQFFRILAVVPAIFIVRLSAYPDGNYPRTWRELMEREDIGGLSIPRNDLDLFNAVVLTLKAEYGDEGICQLARRCAVSLHPSQMTRVRRNIEHPAVSVAPYFFGTMVQDPDLRVIWPEDGAILSPVFMAHRLNDEAILPMVEALESEAVASILSHNGRFPATRPGTDNRLPEDYRYKWVGWDYLYAHDIEAEIKRCEAIFQEETGV